MHPPTSISLKSYRITSIDLLRGVVMVVMALDHIRDYFHAEAFLYDPNDLTQTSPAIFLTRYITHYCAPVFVFLAGTSAFLVGQRKGKTALSSWLIKRGVWLVIVEVVIIKFGWYFKMDMTRIDLMVIWILGMSMIFLAGFIHIPAKFMIAISILVVCTHNLFDAVMAQDVMFPNLWILMHRFEEFQVGQINFWSVYPLIPWIFVMPLGYHFGAYFDKSFDSKLRVKRFTQIGLVLTLIFILLRFTNFYGDMISWEAQKNGVFTFLSYLDLTKYPPSLLYLLVTLGPSILLLAAAENWHDVWAKRLIVIGQVPMFFYIIHIYLIHILAVFAALLTGYSLSDMIIEIWVNYEPSLKGYGFSLWVVYAIWIIMIIGLYPICKRYNIYKANNRSKWWLGYL
jgi:uncharacterized membrane protein